VTDTQVNRSAAQVSESDDQAHLALFSHDIRAAISDVIGGLRLIDPQLLDPAARLQLERVRTAGEALARLVEEAMPMIDEAMPGGESLSSNVHLPRLLHDLEYRWAGRAGEKGLGFDIMARSEVPRLICTDRLDLERILSNLLSNAIKYTDTGKVTLLVEVCDPDTLCFIVEDEGPGFSGPALERLFQYHGRPAGMHKPGTGLGLHIAKEIADDLGGTLDVVNRPGGGGGVAKLCLPKEAWHYAPYLHREDALPDLGDFKILLAEDNVTNQLILAQMLDIMGAEYEIAPDGVEALNWLERERFDAALIDIDMPRLSGIDVMKAIRAENSVYNKLPVMAITAYVLRTNREAIYRAGADRILAKPVLSIDAFGQSLSALLGLQSRSISSAGAPAEPAVELDRSRLDRLLHISGPDGAQQLLARVVTDLTNVRDDLRAAVAREDNFLLRSQTHVLISLAGALGADKLRELAMSLNELAHSEDKPDIAGVSADADRQLHILLETIEHERAKRGGAEHG